MPHVRDHETQQDRRNAKYTSWDEHEQDEEEESADEPFKDLLQRDPTVCDNCFLRRYVEVSHEWWRGTFGWSEYNVWLPFPEANQRIPADEPTGGTRLACGNCGHRGTKHRPIPSERLDEIIEHICETLASKDVAFDREVLVSVIEKRNTSENQGKQDSHVFAPAVRAAVDSERENQYVSVWSES